MIAYVLLLVLLIAAIVTGLPVGFAAGVVALLGAGWYFGDLFDPRAATMIARLAIDKMDDFLLLAIPFFLLAGRLMNTSGITERLFGFVATIVSPFRGGLAHANVLASVMFAGMSGSATADAVGLGAIEMKAMLAHGYDRRFSAGITAASSLISPILPPSIALVAYAVAAQVSVAALFFAALVPGALLAIVYMSWVAWRVRRLGLPAGTRIALSAVWAAFKPAVLSLLTPLIIMGGIYTGAFTPTEAAGIAALYAALLGILVYREIGPRHLLAELRATMIDTAVIMLIIVFTSALGVVMIRAQVPGGLALFFAGLTQNPAVLLLLLMLLWLAVGCFMAQTPAILILTPILLPIVEQYDINLVHFGIVMTLALTLGLLTPPVGMVLYALVRVTGLSFEQLAWVSLPYVLLTVAVTVLLILAPDLVLIVPRALGFAGVG